MTFPGLKKKMEFYDFSRFSMTEYTMNKNNGEYVPLNINGGHETSAYL